MTLDFPKPTRRKSARRSRGLLPALLYALATLVLSYTLTTCSPPTISIRIAEPVQIRGAHVVIVPEGIALLPAEDPEPEPPRRFPEGL